MLSKYWYVGRHRKSKSQGQASGTDNSWSRVRGVALVMTICNQGFGLWEKVTVLLSS